MTTRTLTPKQVVVAEYLALYEYHCEREQLERAGEAPMLWSEPPSCSCGRWTPNSRTPWPPGLPT